MPRFPRGIPAGNFTHRVRLIVPERTKNPPPLDKIETRVWWRPLRVVETEQEGILLTREVTEVYIRYSPKTTHYLRIYWTLTDLEDANERVYNNSVSYTHL